MKFSLRFILLLSLFPGAAAALGLGNLDLESALNEPFSGKIQLLSASVDELDSLNVALADAEAFDRANIDRPFILSELRFKLIRSETGADYIKVSSEQPIREPFLNFLIEVSWANGRLYREYTVLLDPPMYDAEVNVAEIMALKPADSSRAATPDDPGHQVVYADDFDQYSGASGQPTSAPVARTINYSGGDYGPTSANDTLWSIASAMRPDASTSVNQMMLALLQANPDAFAGNNVNGLKRGQILKMPSEDEINALSQSDALAETRKQYAAWEQIKNRLGAGVAERPATSSTPATGSDAGEATDSAVSDAELKLLSAGDTEESTGQVTSVEGAASAADLILAEESIQALTQENLELKDQLQETEALLNDLKRLLELKDDELAKLQQQLAEQELLEEAAAAEPVVEQTVEEVAETPITDEVAEQQTEAVQEEPVAEETSPEEETIEVLEIEPESTSGGIMDMLGPYLAPITDLAGGNPLYAIAAIGLLVVLILIAVAAKLKKAKGTESSDAVEMSADQFPSFDDDESDLDEAQRALDAEAETVLPGAEEELDSEDETFIAGEEDENSEDETYLPERNEEVVEETAPAVATTQAENEEDEDEDPLQEVNTYLAFEQFDQAEEFVRNAIEAKPDNPEYHTKLLEVFYTSGNKKAYEQEAKVLHDLVAGEGEHWDMAVAMWSEMSPNRELFGEGDIEDDDSADNTGGGFVDVTADAEAQDNENTLDFDIGAGEEAAAETDNEDDVLDLTAADDGEDILDVTALGDAEENDDSLDFSEEPTMDTSVDEAEDLLDVTAVGSADDGIDDDVLDVSSKGSSGDDKLESTSAEGSDGGLDLDNDGDMLDLTAAEGESTDSEELMDLDFEGTAADKPEDSDDGDNVIDFDAASAGDDLSLDMDASASSDEDDLNGGLELDLGEKEEDTIADDGLELSLTGEDLSDDEEPIQLDADSGDSDDELPSLDLDIEGADDAGELSLDDSNNEQEDDPGSLDFDLGMDEDLGDDDDIVDGSSTLEMEPPGIDAGNDDDDEDDSTVFVPRTSQAEEQSAEDEIATKLDLAKAYVELGDKDSAKTILDEVMAAGNDEQKQQAQDLLEQV